MQAPTTVGRVFSPILAASLSLVGIPAQATNLRVVEGPRVPGPPVHAGQPAQGVQPMQPGQPVQAVQPGQPGQAVQPVQPGQQGQPVQPGAQQVQPVQPGPQQVQPRQQPGEPRFQPATPPPGYVNMNIKTGPGVVEQLMYYPIPGSSDTREEWEFLCQSPCRVSVHPQSRLRLREGEARGKFEPIGGGENYVSYQPPNRGARAGGGVMMGLGSISVVTGVGILFTSLLLLPVDSERSGGLALWSMIPLFGGLGLIGGGIALVVTHRGRLRVEAQPLALVPRKLVLSPSGLHF